MTLWEDMNFELGRLIWDHTLHDHCSDPELLAPEPTRNGSPETARSHGHGLGFTTACTHASWPSA